MENLERRRTHNLLLISKLLNQRENVSPFTLLLDSLEQSASPLLQEYITRARLSKVKVVYVSYDSFRGPRGVDEFANAAQQEPMRLQKMLQTRIASIESRTIVIFDNLNRISSTIPDLPSYLSSFISPRTSLIGVYHIDIPVISSTASAYSPPSLVLLKHLGTTILTTRSLSHTVARKRARERSVAEPSFGIAEEVEGVITGLGGNDLRGLVFNMEHRRKSGRSMREWLVLHNVSRRDLNPRSERLTPGSVTLLEDHSLFRKLDEEDIKFLDQDQTIDSTFNLGLSERQRKDREGVVLPYFDAQKAEGVGEGGRILYDMGIEDDFDEEEDEI
ncbi:hypothetical protein EV356DRAFT_487357 [Viridothelium virens]|uniref:Elongator complex protein 5 n=1 Tax=Viridothelium virens TaxID=1048519 RepID=A0A6A6H4T9_VIRVR|nr:hypothetical protein EV356DRAFT_487357 [Viridothelium virens]